MTAAIGFGLALVLLSNGLAWLVHTLGIDRQSVYMPWALVLLAAALIWARRRALLSWTELGLREDQWKRSALIGALIGGALSIPLALFFLFPVVLAAPVRYHEIQDLDLRGLVWRLALEIPVAVAFTEEVLFRGILQALFKRSTSIARALVATNLLFALWHLVVGSLSLQQNALALPGIPGSAALVVGYVGALTAVGVGGGCLSLLRERTNHLAGSIVVHWLVDAVITVLVYFR